MSTAEALFEQTVMSGDAKLFVRWMGGYDGGPALIMLHGGPGISHDYLLPLAQLAMPDLRVVFYDQRQVGRSTGIAATRNPLQEWADDLEAVRKALGSEQVHLLGHSAGGLPAIAYASQYPEHTRSIIFVDSVSPTAAQLSQSWSHMLGRLARLQSEGLLPAELPTPTPAEGTAVISAESGVVTPDDGTAFIRAVVPVVHFVKPVDPEILHGATYRPIVGDRIMRALGDYDLRTIVAGLTMPTLNYIAEIPFGSGMAGALFDVLSKDQSAAFTIPDCGHIPWAECPEPFLNKVTSFLETVVRQPS